jgi:hypothetical protein
MEEGMSTVSALADKTARDDEDEPTAAGCDGFAAVFFSFAAVSQRFAAVD